MSWNPCAAFGLPSGNNNNNNNKDDNKDLGQLQFFCPERKVKPLLRWVSFETRLGTLSYGQACARGPCHNCHLGASMQDLWLLELIELPSFPSSFFSLLQPAARNRTRLLGYPRVDW